MDTRTIEEILRAGMIGEMPFPAWLEQVGKVLPLDEPAYMGKPVPLQLAELGITGLRWEPGNNNPDPGRLGQAYLVVTLPERSANSSAKTPSLKLVHDIAVEACGSFFYFTKGDELWIEYLVARPHVRDAIEKSLEAGKLGELPFPEWFRNNPASTSIRMMANELGARGVTAVRWEQDSWQRQLAEAGISWRSYLVVALPMSATVAPPSLPSDRLVSSIAMTLRRTHSYTAEVTESGVELWAEFEVKLPLTQLPGKREH